MFKKVCWYNSMWARYNSMFVKIQKSFHKYSRPTLIKIFVFTNMQKILHKTFFVTNVLFSLKYFTNITKAQIYLYQMLYKERNFYNSFHSKSLLNFRGYYFKVIWRTMKLILFALNLCDRMISTR